MKIGNIANVGDLIVDVYGNKGRIVEGFYDYVRLDTGDHVYRLAIKFIIFEGNKAVC